MVSGEEMAPRGVTPADVLNQSTLQLAAGAKQRLLGMAVHLHLVTARGISPLLQVCTWLGIGRDGSLGLAPTAVRLVLPML